MFKGTITNVTATTSTNIPITPIINTNSNISYDSSANTIIFNTPGYYEIISNIIVTDATVGTITLTEYVNGVASTNAISSTVIVASSDSNTLTTIDIIHVIPSMLTTSKANVSFQLDVAGTISSGTILVERRK